MPIHSRATIRYARALLIAAERTNALGPLRDEVEALRGVIAGAPELRSFLEDPTIAKEDKLATLNRLFGGKVSPLMGQFLRMLAEKYRERMLPDILDMTVGLLDEREGKVLAEVRTAAAMSDEQQGRLREQLQRITGKEVKLRVTEEVSLVAGFVARIGDTVFDASLAAQLGRLRESLRRADLRAAAGA